jgi:hypothetical protein
VTLRFGSRSVYTPGCRRISLLHAQGRSWAEIGRFVGQRKLSITADTYTHVLIEGRELDYSAL